jgi:hypothetical protein
MRRSTQALFDRRSSLGLVGNSMDVETGAWVSREATIGPGSDSYYEYLLKVQGVRACVHALVVVLQAVIRRGLRIGRVADFKCLR